MSCGAFQWLTCRGAGPTHCGGMESQRIRKEVLRRRKPAPWLWRRPRTSQPKQRASRVTQAAADDGASGACGPRELFDLGEQGRVECELREYDHLITKPKLEEADKITDPGVINERSSAVTPAMYHGKARAVAVAA